MEYAALELLPSDSADLTPEDEEKNWEEPKHHECTGLPQQTGEYKGLQGIVQPEGNAKDR